MYGAPLARGVPSDGDYGIGVVTAIPSALSDNWELRFLWRDPIDGTPEEFTSVQFGKHRLLASKFLKLDGSPPPQPGSARASASTEATTHALPEPYTAADVALLRGNTSIVPGLINPNHLFDVEKAGFHVHRSKFH